MKMRILILALGAIVLAGCAWKYTTEVESDPDADFTQYRTFAFPDTAVSEANAFTTSPDDVRRLQAAFAKRLQAAGLRRVFQENQGDLVVSYGVVARSGSSTRVVPMAWSRGHDANVTQQSMDSHGMQTGSYDEVRHEDHNEGTLLLELYDPRLRKVAWRTWISGRVTGNMNSNFQSLEDGLAKAFEDFPPKSPPKKK